VRDTALAINSNDAIPRSDVNREFFAEEHDRKVRVPISNELDDFLNRSIIIIFVKRTFEE
jgi:hypothetical protein